VRNYTGQAIAVAGREETRNEGRQRKRRGKNRGS